MREKVELSEQANLIDHIEETLEALEGQTVHVEQDLGRSRISSNTGLVYQVHPRLFILEVQRKRAPKARISYQYADILTGIVKVFKDGESLFEDYKELLAVKKEPYDESEFLGNDFEEEKILN